MKIDRKLFQRSNRGYVLLITMVFIGISLLLLVSFMNWTNTGSKLAERNNLFSISTGAAAASTARVIAQMQRDFYSQSFHDASDYINYTASTNGWPFQFLFSNGSGVPNQTYVSTSPTDWSTNVVELTATNSQYAGLYAAVAECTVISTATTINQPYTVSATVKQTFQLASIPIFQFAIFYNLNMEIDPGGAMTVTGPVFSNGGLWSGSSSLTFNSSVSAAGTATTTNADPYATGKTGSGGTPTNNFLGGLPLSDATALSMPIGTNTSADSVRQLIGLPPSDVDPNSLVGQQYPYNTADLIISNSSSGTITAFYQDTNSAPRLTTIPYDAKTVTANTLTNGYTTNTTSTITPGTPIYNRHHQITGYTSPTTNTSTTITPNTTTTYSTNYDAYSFVTNVTFYDYREGKTVQAVQLDVGALNTWMTNTTTTGGSAFNSLDQTDKGHGISSAYIYNAANPSSSTLPSARVTDGASLPSSGLTVVTPDPLYVLGNYNLNNGDTSAGQTNTTHTKPAALMGDAITVLSANWNDDYTSSTSLSSRNPVNTTINAAAFEGIVESSGSNYSGGVENFLRLLENWSGKTLTYNGSIVAMFPSQYATNFWNGNYYSVPTRKWAFDLNFKDATKIPPLTPQVKALVRQTWTAY
jgi:hypothetical protein